MPTLPTLDVDLITGISFSFDTDNQLKATIYRRSFHLYGTMSENPTTATVNIPLYKYSFVSGAVYSESNKDFKLKRAQGVAPASSQSETTDSSPVFTAVPHDTAYGSD